MTTLFSFQKNLDFVAIFVWQIFGSLVRQIFAATFRGWLVEVIVVYFSLFRTFLFRDILFGEFHLWKFLSGYFPCPTHGFTVLVFRDGQSYFWRCGLRFRTVQVAAFSFLSSGTGRRENYWMTCTILRHCCQIFKFEGRFFHDESVFRCCDVANVIAIGNNTLSFKDLKLY